MATKKKKVLIIGGCGYIGSRLFIFLKKRKYKVDTVDLEWYGNYVNPKNIKTDFKNLKREFLSKFDIIIFLAAHSNYFMCESHPIEAFQNNVTNTIKFVNQLSNQMFIYASSYLVYEKSVSRIVTEDSDRYFPSTKYDLTKQIVDYYMQLTKVNYYGLRFGTVSGYSPNLRTDVMINRMYHTSISEGIIRIYNPENFRPVLGIEDLCRAVEKIIISKGPKGIYNLASFNLKLKIISGKVSKKLGNLKVVKEDRNPLRSYSMSTKKFRKMFNFTFKDTVESILKSLEKNYKKTPKSERK